MSRGRHIFSSMLIAMLMGVPYVFGQDDCTIEESLIVCETRLPKIVPENVTRVIIKDFSYENINNRTFLHMTWRSVYFLDVTVNLHINFRLYNYNFFPLRNVKTLGIHSPGLVMDGEKHLLYGLAKLQILNLSSCYQLETHELFNLLDTMIGLDTLILDQTSLFSNRKFLMNNAFFLLISKTKIRMLSLSGCNLVLQGPLNFNNISFSWNIVNVSNTTIAMINVSLSDVIQLTKLFAIVKSLDMSYISGRFWDISYADGIPWCNNLFYSLEYLTLNHVSTRNIIINNSFHDLSRCKMLLKTFHLRSNNIHYYNRTTIWPNKTRLFELDLSFNNMEFLSPGAFGPVTTLEIFLLAHNSLYRMAHYKEFKALFVTFTKLRHLDLSHNNLTWLPNEMFVNNDGLTVLDISYNELASVRFKIVHLLKLQFLNLESNRIHYIDGVDLNNLVMLAMNLPKTSKINFYGNPLLCSCKSEAFIKWIETTVNRETSKPYSCSLDGKLVSIDTNTVQKTRFLCIRSIIIIASVSSSATVLIISSILASFIVHRRQKRRRKRKQENFVKEFKDGLLCEKFLCFLSFASEDDGNCVNEIYRNLGETLKELIATEKEVICIGDRNFHPGFPLVDEILRCIEESCVVIFVVSNKFCDSQWCQMELREAYELNKPIILICIEDTDVLKMPRMMLNIFQKFARVKVVPKDNGQYEIIPTYEQLSQSILLMAMTRYGNELYTQSQERI